MVEIGGFMKAATWAFFGVLFLLGSFLFWPLLLGALVCFIGMVIAIQVKPPQTLAGIQTPNGLVQTSTTAHWSTFERMTGEYAGIYRVFLSKNTDEASLNKLRIGDSLSVKPARTKNERGVTLDYLVVTNSAGSAMGHLPEQLATKYLDAMKTGGAEFAGRVHHIVKESTDTAVLVEFDRCDTKYLADRKRRQFWKTDGKVIVVCVAISLAVAAWLFLVN
jgi:hypothetical protein